MEKTTPLRALVTVVLHSDGYVEVWGNEESLKARVIKLWPGDKLPAKFSGSLLATGVPQTERRRKPLTRAESATAAIKKAGIVPGGVLQEHLKAIGMTEAEAVAGIHAREEADRKRNRILNL